MKKILFVAAIVSIFNFEFSVSRAQVGTDFGVNMFMSLDGGASVYTTQKNDNPWGFGGGITVGKWFLSPLAFQVSFDFMTVANAYGDNFTANFALASAEYKWDFMSTFTRIRHWKLNFYPMLGLGVCFRAAGGGHPTDHEFQTMLGGHLAYRFSKGWDAFLQGKVHFFPEAFDQGGGGSYLTTLTFGVTRNFTESPFHRRTENESRGVAEDWFVGAGFGMNYSSFTFEHFKPFDMWGFAPEIMFGRNYSNFWTIRFELNGLTAHERYDTVNQVPGKGYSYSNFHTDVMINITNAFDFTRGRRLNVLPYLGAGLVWRYSNVQFDMAADFGVMLRCYVGRNSDLYLDAKYLMVPPRIAGGQVGENLGIGGILGSGLIWVGLPSITVGYIYNFGHSTTRYRLPAHWCPE